MGKSRSSSFFIIGNHTKKSWVTGIGAGFVFGRFRSIIFSQWQVISQWLTGTHDTFGAEVSLEWLGYRTDRKIGSVIYFSKYHVCGWRCLSPTCHQNPNGTRKCTFFNNRNWMHLRYSGALQNIGLNPLIFLKTMLIPLNLEDTPPPLGGVRYGTSKYRIFSAPAAGS